MSARMEVSRLAATLLFAAGSLLCGRAAAVRRPRLAAPISGVCALVAVVCGAARHQPVRGIAGPLLSWIGGEALVACYAMLLILGAAMGSTASVPRKRFLGLLAAIPTAILCTIAGSPLYWHFSGASLRSNLPNDEGLLVQRTGVTCAPAAAAMLLHLRGANMSEGMLAESCGTNPIIGTDEWALAGAMERASGKLAGHAGTLDYVGASKLGLPFVAYVRREGIGGHAILVIRIEGSSIQTADPLSGARDTMDRTSFEQEWNGTAVWLE